MSEAVITEPIGTRKLFHVFIQSEVLDIYATNAAMAEEIVVRRLKDDLYKLQMKTYEAGPGAEISLPAGSPVGKLMAEDKVTNTLCSTCATAPCNIDRSKYHATNPTEVCGSYTHKV